jgi:hypothetical protein
MSACVRVRVASKTNYYRITFTVTTSEYFHFLAAVARVAARASPAPFVWEMFVLLRGDTLEEVAPRNHINNISAVVNVRPLRSVQIRFLIDTTWKTFPSPS